MILVALAAAAATRISDTGPLTTVHLIIIAIFAVVVVLGILWGARQKRIRAASEHEEERRVEELEAHPPAAPASPLPPTEISAPVAATRVAPKLAPVVSPKSPAKPKPAAKRSSKPAEPKAVAEPLPPKAAPKPRAKPVAKPAAAPVEAPVAAAPVAAAPAQSGFSLTDVKGLGPRAVPMLQALGVADIAALAALSPERAAEIDGQLGALSGRLARDRWVEQAKLLAAGDVAAFEQTYGKL